VCWELMAEDAEEGVAFDGLVWIDDHFAWFPKPWRFIPQPTTRTFANWAE
jgi:hypothetical protein